MTIPHLAFFRRLAAIPQTTSQEWYRIYAGLAVLKLVDDWIPVGPSLFAANTGGLAAVQQAVARITPRSSIRQALGATVSAIEVADGVDLVAVSIPLFTYGTALRQRGDLALAADVYDSLSQHAARMATTVGDPQLLHSVSFRATLQLGSIFREQGAYTEAEHAYGLALSAATREGDVEHALLARLGSVNVIIMRGNLPHAQELLDSLVHDAIVYGSPEFHAKTLHESAHLAVLQHQYDKAAILAYNALRKARASDARERILADLAVILAHVGHFVAARDANQLLRAVARDYSVRQQATINLLELASLDGNAVAFARYRRVLTKASMPPRLRGYFYLEAARGFRRFGQHADAQIAFEQAHAIALDHGLNQLVFVVEAEWQVPIDVASPSNTGSRATAWPSDIVYIAARLDAWRRYDGEDPETLWAHVSEDVTG